MTFDQAQGMFRTHKTYETAFTYLVVASQRKADEVTNQDALFNAVGEVASWLSASDEHLLAFEVAKKATAWASSRGPAISVRQSAWFKAAREQELRSVASASKRGDQARSPNWGIVCPNAFSDFGLVRRDVFAGGSLDYCFLIPNRRLP